MCKNGSGRGGSLFEQASEYFLAQRLSSLFGVLNIAEAAVSPSHSSGPILSTFERHISCYQVLTPDPFGAGSGGQT